MILIFKIFTYDNDWTCKHSLPDMTSNHGYFEEELEQLVSMFIFYGLLKQD